MSEKYMEMEVIEDIDDEEYKKQKADSPALTEATSCTSSPESSPHNASKNSSIRRALFKANREEDSKKETILGQGSPSPNLVGGGAVLTPSTGENGIADTTSITSSETTVPSWNLSLKDAKERNVEVPLDHFILSQPVPLLSTPPMFRLNQPHPMMSSPSSVASDESHISDDSKLQSVSDETVSYSPTESDNKENIDVATKQKKKPSVVVHIETKQTNDPSVVVEDPPDQPASCNAALNLAEMVFAFGQSARQRCQGSEQRGKSATNVKSKTPSSNNNGKSTRADTLVGSPPPIMTTRHLSESSTQSDKSQKSYARSIKRERDLLKIASKRDAETISKLQQAIDAQKQLNSLKEVEIVDKQAEFQLLEKRIRKLQKEHEDHLERENELHETIKILKKELDKVTLLSAVPSDELNYLQLEFERPSSESHTDNYSEEARVVTSRAKEQEARIVELEGILKEREKENFDLKTKIDWLNNRHKDDDEEEKVEEHHEAVEIERDEHLNAPVISDKKEIEALLPIVSEKREIETLLKDIMKRLEAVEIEKKGKESSDLDHNDVEIDVLEDPDAIEAMKLKQRTQEVVDSEIQSTWCCDWNLISGE